MSVELYIAQVGYHPGFDVNFSEEFLTKVADDLDALKEKNPKLITARFDGQALIGIFEDDIVNDPNFTVTLV